jgi:hypothetical protein
MNQHSDYIDKRINDYKKNSKWNTRISNTSHEDIITDFSACLFTNLTRDTFTAAYLKKHPCSDCGAPSKERCHGIGEERPILLRRALARVFPDITQSICIKDIIIAYLEEHKTTKFTFKCEACHKKEGNPRLIRKQQASTPTIDS